MQISIESALFKSPSQYPIENIKDILDLQHARRDHVQRVQWANATYSMSEYIDSL